MAGSLSEAAYPFAISLAIGTLVGVERERKRLRSAEDRSSLPGGIRTFPLIALLGCTVAWLGERYGAPVFAVGLAGFGLLVAAIYVLTSLKGDLGATTEVAALLTFALGAMVYGGEALLASGLGVAMTVLLSAREQLHATVQTLDSDDLYAALTLAVVSVIVLPMLPDLGYGPYEVWNPRRIWLLVVFISSIGFAGYVGIKVLGAGLGNALAGLLGGMVSSTAATLSFAARSRDDPQLSREFALAIALAWAAMFVRVIAEVAVVNPQLVKAVAGPIGAAAVAGAGGAGLILLLARRAEAHESAPGQYKNPFSLWSAMKFGVLFAIVLIVAKVAQVQFREAGVFAAAALTGLLDVDAMTLTAARLAKEGQLSETAAAQAVFIAATSNTLMKAGMAASLGSPGLRRTLLPVAAASLAAGGAVAFFMS